VDWEAGASDGESWLNGSSEAPFTHRRYPRCGEHRQYWRSSIPEACAPVEHHRRHQYRCQVVPILCGVRTDLAQGLRNTGVDAQIGQEQIVPETTCPDTNTQDGGLRGGAILGENVYTTCS
jgi:hypothetical protein